MGSEIIIDVEQLAEVLGRDIENMERHLVSRVALEVAMEAEAAAVVLTDEAGAVDAGFFKARWQVVGTSKGAELRNDTPYAGVIEFGRRPRRPGPPLAPIVEWVRRKLIPNGIVVPAEGESAEDAALRVGARIRLAIHERGTKPRHILGTLNEELPVMTRRALLRHFRPRLLTGG